MLIRYGFDLEIRLWQPTTLITAMDVHESQREAVVWETNSRLRPASACKRFSTKRATS